MGAVGRFLGWFVLAPYFASWAVPMIRPIGTDNIELAKRWRAQSVIMLDIIVIAFGLLSLSGRIAMLTSLSILWAGVLGALFSLAVTVAIALIINRERERQLRADYNSMPRWKRRAFACTSWAFVVAMFVAILWFGAPKGEIVAGSDNVAASTKLRCDGAATEMMADSCSPAAAR